MVQPVPLAEKQPHGDICPASAMKAARRRAGPAWHARRPHYLFLVCVRLQPALSLYDAPPGMVLDGRGQKRFVLGYCSSPAFAH